ncbi:MAG: SLC13 family permease [Phycisphaerales bacterium]
MSEDGPPTSSATARLTGLVLGPVLGVVVGMLISHFAGLATPAAVCGGVAALMAVWWLTEALPLAATALVPIVAFPVLNVTTAKEAAAPYGDEVVFLFLGGFLIQLAMERWNLHRRIALLILLGVGTSPARLVAGLMAGAALISMWVSNAATAAMMLPIGLSLCGFVARGGGSAEVHPAQHPRAEVRNFATCSMIGIAWAATIGGLATPIGTAPNVIIRTYLERNCGTPISFAQWMVLAGPTSIILLVSAYFILTRWCFPVSAAGSGTAPAADQRAFIQARLAELGPVSRGEWSTLAVFLLAVLGWIFGKDLSHLIGAVRIGKNGEPEHMIRDGVVAIAAALLLFIIPVNLKRATPVLDWESAKRMPYGVLLLFGGGMSLAEAMSSTGLSRALGDGLATLDTLHPFVLVLLVTAVCVFISELVSNTALAQTMQTVMGPAAAALGLGPAVLLMPTALGASCAFMMPAGTPPSAICFSSGCFTIRQMARAGLALNVVGVVTISLSLYLLTPIVLPPAKVAGGREDRRASAALTTSADGRTVSAEASGR